MEVDALGKFPDMGGDDQARPLDPHFHLVALDRSFGGAMAWGLMS